MSGGPVDTRSIHEASYFPREALLLKPDVPGARVWGVALDKTLLTYFEVEPHCRFERHHHESEQITMVLEGELFFELDAATYCVRQGDVIAIPSNLPHAVFTTDKHVKAVDAWSPVMPQFLKREDGRREAVDPRGDPARPSGFRPESFKVQTGTST
jgi:quercetin dioxygenase-like cupin family protein